MDYQSIFPAASQDLCVPGRTDYLQLGPYSHFFKVGLKGDERVRKERD